MKPRTGPITTKDGLVDQEAAWLLIYALYQEGEAQKAAEAQAAPTTAPQSAPPQKQAA